MVLPVPMKSTGILALNTVQEMLHVFVVSDEIQIHSLFKVESLSAECICCKADMWVETKHKRAEINIPSICHQQFRVY